MTAPAPPQDEAARQVAALQRQLQLLTQAVSHDLRAPLRAIESFSTRVATSAHDRLQPEEREQLQRVHDAAVRMSALLAALNDWSHAGLAPMVVGPVDLSLLAEWAIADLREAHPGREVEAHVQPGLVTHGDERLLRRLFGHLLGNAWQFAPAGEPVRIEVGGARMDDRLRITVRDHGIGFDPRHAHKLFEPLQRLHGPQEGARHGLGLATALEIVQRHGGSLTAASRPGDGAEFTVELPWVDGDAQGDA